MLKKIINFFHEPPEIERIKDSQKLEHSYRYFRIRMLYSSIIGYAFFYFTRKNIAIALPLLSKDLGYTNSELGILGSLHYVSYAVAKGLFGFAGDRADTARFMAVGLAISAVLNIFFGLTESLLFFAVIWTLNGLFQAMGAPPCAKTCVRWFSVSERGTKWALWNISHQAGGGIILVLAAWLAEWFGWRGVFIGPALLCFLGTWFILSRIRDRPEAVGLPPVEVYRNDPEKAGEISSEKTEQIPFFDLVVRRVLLNPRLLLFATGSFFLYIVRFGVLDWATKYLVEQKGEDIGWAGTITSLVEFIGIPGMLAAGWISDRFFRARRAPICIIYLFLLAVSIGLFYIIPSENPWLDALALGTIGFFTYGPQMILAGVAAADSCGAQVAAAAVGVTGFFSYAGATVSSIGTGALIDQYGWEGGFAMWICCSVAGALLLIPLWNARGRRV